MVFNNGFHDSHVWGYFFDLGLYLSTSVKILVLVL